MTEYIKKDNNNERKHLPNGFPTLNHHGKPLIRVYILDLLGWISRKLHTYVTRLRISRHKQGEVAPAIQARVWC